ncbi:MAG: hypothetical protein ACRCS3_08060 [Paracoccaceae bacterium]
MAVSAAFVVALLTGHWEDAGDLMEHVWAVAGLIACGVVAAPMAGYVTRIVPQKVLMVAVGVLVCLLAIYQTARLL